MANIVKLAMAAAVIAGFLGVDSVFGNGGPFVVKHPTGDPAAKGILARLDPTLKPGRETRLRVVKEDLTISFAPNLYGSRLMGFSKDQVPPPLATVTAAYTIENPTPKEVNVDFGFPILRGIYISPLSMAPSPSVSVHVDKKYMPTTIISNSVIYGIIRQRARKTIEEAISADANLERLVHLVAPSRNIEQNAPAQPAAQQQTQQRALPRVNAPAVNLPNLATACRELSEYLTGKLNWNPRDAALMVQFANLDFGKQKSYPHDRWHHPWRLAKDSKVNELLSSNLGPLSAIGEQKATQFFARLASRFDKNSPAEYEAIFKAWGGSVTERSVDLKTGKIRPRELATKKGDQKKPAMAHYMLRGSDPTVYARVEYLDPKAKISESEKASCRAVLKNLPVVFTFAPMNLLHYQVPFPPGAKRIVTITYRQYAYKDTASTGSYQLAYVLHPATLWDNFGPINLKIVAPQGVACRASVPVAKTTPVAKATPVTEATPAAKANAPQQKNIFSADLDIPFLKRDPVKLDTYEARLVSTREKTGELFIGLDKAAWDAMMKRTAPKPVQVSKVGKAFPE